MAEPGGRATRVATNEDADVIGRLLHAFNVEFDEPTPSPDSLAERVRQLMGSGDTTVVLGGDGPDGLAVLRFRPALWSAGLECYVAELYVVPELRGRGLGRAIMDVAIEVARGRGADTMDLGTDEFDTVAHHLYESLGFSNRTGGPEGELMFVYEREL